MSARIERARVHERRRAVCTRSSAAARQPPRAQFSLSAESRIFATALRTLASPRLYRGFFRPAEGLARSLAPRASRIASAFVARSRAATMVQLALRLRLSARLPALRRLFSSAVAAKAQLARPAEVRPRSLARAMARSLARLPAAPLTAAPLSLILRLAARAAERAPQRRGGARGARARRRGRRGGEPPLLALPPNSRHSLTSSPRPLCAGRDVRRRRRRDGPPDRVREARAARGPRRRALQVLRRALPPRRGAPPLSTVRARGGASCCSSLARARVLAWARARRRAASRLDYRLTA